MTPLQQILSTFRKASKTNGTDEYQAIQCKFYAEDYRIQKKDIDSFFTASGQKPFTHRVLVTTTNNWSGNAQDAKVLKRIRRML